MMIRFRTAWIAVLCVGILPAHSQNTYSATKGGVPLTVGVGISNFDTNWVDSTGNYSRRMDGATLWADWSFRTLSHHLSGLSAEVEGRDISFARPVQLPNMRFDTAEVGLLYAWQKHHLFHPYAKYLMGLGSVDFPGVPGYQHDTRTVTAPGVGIDIYATHSLWVRADYEYQFWPQLSYHGGSIEPNGVTLGVVYDFAGMHRR